MCRSSPIRSAGCCGRLPLCPGPSMTSVRPASTVSSTLSQGPASSAGPTRDTKAGGTVRVPYRGRWETLSTGQQAVNRSHAKIRAPVEQAVATLKSWRLLRKLRCSTTRITSLVQAVLTLHLASSG